MLAKCCECGKEISTDAKRCPNCGYDYKDEDENIVYGYYERDGSGYRRLSLPECKSENYKEHKEEREEQHERSKISDKCRIIENIGFVAAVIIFIVCLANGAFLSAFYVFIATVVSGFVLSLISCYLYDVLKALGYYDKT